MVMLGEKTIITRAKDVVGSLVEDEFILMSMDAGTFNLLDGPAADIWGFLDQPQSFENVVEHLLEIYEVDRTKCKSDCKELLQNMAALNLIVLS